jgi:hypothetical protein
MKYLFIPVIIALLSIFNCAQAQQLNDFNYIGSPHAYQTPAVSNSYQFNGYTTYWHNNYRWWYRYGYLWKMSVPNVQKTLKQSKIDIAEDMGVPGLFMEEGFVDGLLTGSYITLQTPSINKLKEAIRKGKNVLIYTDPNSSVGQKLKARLPSAATRWRQALGAYQYNSPAIKMINAFYLQNGKGQKIYVISSRSQAARQHLKELIVNAKQVLSKYELRKGWFGVQTFIKSVTINPGGPLDLIGRGMNEGDSWFVFTGYMAYRMKRHHELQHWLREIGSPVVTDLGITRGSLYGCNNYKGYQIQAMADLKSKKIYLKYAHQHGCYIFRPFFKATGSNEHISSAFPAPSSGSSNGYIGSYTGKISNHHPYIRPGSNGHIGPYTGYYAGVGHKEVIDTSHVPFVLKAGRLGGGLVRSMVLFVPKGKEFTRKAMWDAILDRREVGILKQGKMMGSPNYRHTLDLLVLDGTYLEQYFGGRINLRSRTDGDTLKVSVKNLYDHPVTGELSLTLPSGLKVSGDMSRRLSLPAKTVKKMSFKLQPKASAMNKRNPIAVYFKWNGHKKGTLTKLKLPPAISVHRLLYGEAPAIKYPVAIHNFTRKKSYAVKVRVFKEGEQSKPVFHATQTGHAAPGHYEDMLFKLHIPPGKYEVKVSALGQEYTSQLGVGGEKLDGMGAKAYPVDMNGDGTSEYIMENDSVKVALLTTGARIIQYVVKSQHKNEFIQIWPHQPWDSLMAYRKRLYYPFGGFEDFLGEPSLETFKRYHAKIIKKSGRYVQVRMSADYYGSTITKTFTLYGNTPLVGIRFAIDMHYPASNMLGPEPMLKIDKKWNSQVITLPTIHGIRHYRPSEGMDDGIHYHNSNPNQNWGMVLDLKAGWNAGQAVDQNLSWVGAFPVSQPLFLHMWFNTPSNIHNSPYTYIELQPWTPIYEKSTMYFSYYMWGMDGSWKKSLQELKKRNLITHSHK